MLFVIIVGISFSILFLQSLWFLAGQVIVEDSLLYSLGSIDIFSVIELSILIALLLFLLLSFLLIILVVIREMKIISASQTERIANFSGKLLVAAYPTILLASIFDEHYFSLITNIISFFVIFSFVFSRKDSMESTTKKKSDE